MWRASARPGPVPVPGKAPGRCRPPRVALAETGGHVVVWGFLHAP
jgi:hypothetical protein